jgi:methionine synthase II (cobalamin-independent)
MWHAGTDQIGFTTAGVNRLTISTTDITSTLTVTAPNFNTTSDIRLKDNIRTFESAMDVISQLRGVRFAWKETGVETVGLIAQEVEKVLPELIGINTDTGLKSVSYSNMVAVLIEAVKELKAEIEELKKR